MQKEIFNYLKESTGYISGEDISRELKISRSAIWKYMQELRREGYEIVAVPHLGYQLKHSPDKLLSHEIQYELDTRYMGKTVYHHESLISTMETAFKLGMEGEPEGTLVCAETQTQGKGRLGRQWSSPKGKGIYMSLILRPQVSPLQVSKLTLLAAVAVCEAIRSETQVDVQIKWPNDLLVGDKKIAGILTELNAEMDRVRFVVIGIGINANTAPSALPDIGTSLKQCSNKTIDRVSLVKEIMRRFEHWYEVYKEKGFEEVGMKWKEYSSTLGKHIKISDSAGAVEIEGEAIDLDESGGLLIKSTSGETIKRMSGDVIQIR